MGAIEMVAVRSSQRLAPGGYRRCLRAPAGLSLVLTCAAFCAVVLPVQAHHSFAAQFDVNKPVTLMGILVRMDWVNPHGRMYVDVPVADGTVEHWSIETGGTTQLLRRGFGKSDFQAGSEITIKGFRSRDGGRAVHGETVILKDGRSLFIGEIPIT